MSALICLYTICSSIISGWQWDLMTQWIKMLSGRTQYVWTDQMQKKGKWDNKESKQNKSTLLFFLEWLYRKKNLLEMEIWWKSILCKISVVIFLYTCKHLFNLRSTNAMKKIKTNIFSSIPSSLKTAKTIKHTSMSHTVTLDTRVNTHMPFWWSN